MYQLEKKECFSIVSKKSCRRNVLALILQPKVSDVKYFPLELIKPNDQLNFSATVLFDNEVV